jgi:AcrR family transcriptional regulator
MTTENRRDREKEEMKELILSAATEIIAAEGVDNLSIRKIANKIEYSPSIVYHYFKDKNEILNIVMQRGYSKIVMAVSTKNDGEDPRERLRTMAKSYINSALMMPDEFMAAQINKTPEVLKHTTFLFKGASDNKPALRSLYECLKEVYKDEDVDEDTIELTAQIIATSTLGLIIKLILEKEIGEEQREKLIDFYSNEIVLRMVNIN